MIGQEVGNLQRTGALNSTCASRRTGQIDELVHVPGHRLILSHQGKRPDALKRSGRDGVGSQYPFQQAQRGQRLVIMIWWRLVVPAGDCRGWWSVPVCDVQNESVGRSFVSVTRHLTVDGLGHAELLGQRCEAGGRDEDPPAAALLGEMEGGERFQCLVDRRPRQTHRCGQVETCQRLLRVFQRLVHQRRRNAQLQEHRPQRVQLPAPPGLPAGPIGIFRWNDQFLQVAVDAAFPVDQLDQRIRSGPQRPQVSGNGGVVHTRADAQRPGAEVHA